MPILVKQSYAYAVRVKVLVALTVLYSRNLRETASFAPWKLVQALCSPGGCAKKSIAMFI
jgi:hypothetical protein